MKKWLVFFALSLLFAVAQADEKTGAAAAATVENQAATILKKLSEDKETYQNDPLRFAKLIESEILPYFDFDIMTRYILGRHARSATPEQKKAFEEAFRELLIRVYSKGWSKYVDAEVTVTNNPSLDNYGRASVRIAITMPNGKKIPGIFSMRYKDNTWKAYDVSFENVSIVTSYRNSMDTEIKNKGLDQVIEDLKQMNKDGKTE